MFIYCGACLLDGYFLDSVFHYQSSTETILAFVSSIYGAGGGNRTRISTLARLRTDHCPTPAYMVGMVGITPRILLLKSRFSNIPQSSYFETTRSTYFTDRLRFLIAYMPWCSLTDSNCRPQSCKDCLLPLN